MYKILKLNKISDVVNDLAEKDSYLFCEEDGAPYSPDAILVRSKDLHQMALNPELLAIARAGAGTNTIPVEKCSEQGVVVFNTPGANANSVKEMVICAIIMGCRNVTESIDWTLSLKGRADEVPAVAEKGKKAFNGHEILGKKLGILGLGAIGGLVAEAALSLGMKVYGYDPYLSVKSAWSLPKGIIHAEKDEILRECDVITIHIPLLPSTKNYIGEHEFSLMKNAVLLNFSRADLVDREALLPAIAAGQVRKYFVDFPTDDILGVENVVSLPHLASCTDEAEENCAIMAMRELDDYLRNGNIKNSVNYPELVMNRSGNHRLCVMHKNEIGVIKKITTALEDQRINILNMGNASRNTLAYSVFDVCSEVDLEAINALDVVIRSRIV